MIPALLIWLYKRYGRPFLNKYNLSLNNILTPLRNVTITILFVMIGVKASAQEQTLNYNVLHSGKTVGHMTLQKHSDGDDTFLKVASDVKISFLFSVNIKIEEDSHYRDGKLMSSHVCRMVNGKQKANKTTKANGDNYQLVDDGKTTAFNQKQINSNLNMMYLHEPVGLSQIYSDNFQQFVQIKQVDNHIYRINLPDGNYNFYTYTNGICTRVDVHHSLYTIQIQLA